MLHNGVRGRKLFLFAFSLSLLHLSYPFMLFMNNLCVIGREKHKAARSDQTIPSPYISTRWAWLSPTQPLVVLVVHWCDRKQLQTHRIAMGFSLIGCADESSSACATVPTENLKSRLFLWSHRKLHSQQWDVLMLVIFLLLFSFLFFSLSLSVKLRV